MSSYVEISFRAAGQLYLFEAGEFELVLEERVIVQTEHGPALGTVKSNRSVESQPPVNFKIYPVIRRASEEDIQREQRHLRKEDEAFAFCREKIDSHRLPMKLVRAEYLYSGSKLLFYFSAEGRIDFRLLVRDLARHFRMRIEMRQIGVRDSAKLIGGIGPCGQELCCSRFLRNFNPVSIRMAKDQNLTLNPQKVSGVCGRLMCCLSYEQDLYHAVRRALPKVGRLVETAEGKGRVREVLPLKESVIVTFWEEDPPFEKEYKLSELPEYSKNSATMWESLQESDEDEDGKSKRKVRRGIEPLMEPRGKIAVQKPRPKRSEEPDLRGGRERDASISVPPPRRSRSRSQDGLQAVPRGGNKTVSSGGPEPVVAQREVEQMPVSEPPVKLSSGGPESTRPKAKQEVEGASELRTSAESSAVSEVTEVEQGGENKSKNPRDRRRRNRRRKRPQEGEGGGAARAKKEGPSANEEGVHKRAEPPKSEAVRSTGEAKGPLGGGGAENQSGNGGGGGVPQKEPTGGERSDATSEEKKKNNKRRRRRKK